MPVVKPLPIMTPVAARGGTLIHATSLATPRFTACGKRCDSWIVQTTRVSCQDCKRLMFFKVK